MNFFGKKSKDSDDIPVIKNLNTGTTAKRDDSAFEAGGDLPPKSGAGDDFKAARQSRNVINFQTAAGGHTTASVGGAAKSMKVMVVEPVTFDDAQHVADHIKNRKPVVINFENTETAVAKRIIDFVSGTTYALAGNLQKVGKDIFLCAPSNVDVSLPDQQQEKKTHDNSSELPKWNK
jgi:cell division inhibitor SepF